MRREEDRGERKGLKDSGCGGQEGTGGPRSSPALNVHQGTERRNSLCSSSPTRQRLWRFSAWSFHLHRGRRVRLPSVLYDWEPRSALFLDEGRQGDASQLQQEDPPRVVQRGGHKLLRLLRHQIRGADDAAFSFARPAPRCGALQPATSRGGACGWPHRTFSFDRR